MESITQEAIFIIQLIVALLLGMTIGTERSMAHKTAGMRTFGLVALGSCLFVIISEVVNATYFSQGATIEPLRMAASVITGIGFIGAGTILFRKHHLVGLTSAAGLWVAAGIGVAVGFKLFVIAIATTFLTLITFTILWHIEEKVKHLSIEDDHFDDEV
jgi:putative Mg2+ transporter-C (MgtC) family protein